MPPCTPLDRVPNRSVIAAVAFWWICFIAPALLLALPAWLNLGSVYPAVTIWTSYTLLLIYPGYLLYVIVSKSCHIGRTSLSSAAVLGFGLYTLPAVFTILRGNTLTSLIGIVIAYTTALAVVAAWRLRKRSLPAMFLDPVSQIKQTARHVHARLPSELLFWAALITALLTFVTFAGIDRFSDRQTYQAQIRLYLDGSTLNTTSNALYDVVSLRLLLAPWLFGLAAVVQLANVDLTQAYSYALPLFCSRLASLPPGVWDAQSPVLVSGQGLVWVFLSIIGLAPSHFLLLPSIVGSNVFSYAQKAHLLRLASGR